MKAEEVIALYKLFEKNGIKVWLDGGWGVDALLGKQTRSHGDIDIVVQEKDIPEIRQMLENKGYKDVSRDDTRTWNFVLGDGNGHEVDVHVVVLDSEGNGIYGPKENGEAYPANSLVGKGKINDVEVRCLTAEYQVKSHTGYKISEKDLKDVKALCDRFNVQYPKEYKNLNFQKQ